VERDLIGYGPNPPKIEWPGGARIALSIVVNYEEGSERSPAWGDAVHETSGEIESTKPRDMRDYRLESQWEYGSRAGVWRVLRLLKKYDAKATFFACGMALERNPALGPELVAQGHAVCCHGYRWATQWDLAREDEREEIRRGIAAVERCTGARPLSWFTRGGVGENTRDLLVEEGFLYDSDAFNDDLPYYSYVNGKPWLVVPYTSDSNDGKWWKGGGWTTGEQFLDYIRDGFDMLYEEGSTHPRMLVVAIHSRICGRPGRALAVEHFLQHVRSHPGVWIATRDEIAQWWLKRYPPA